MERKQRTINGARKQRKQQYEKIDETERQRSMKKRAGGESAEEKGRFDGAGCSRRAPIAIEDAPARAQPKPNRSKTLGSGPAQARDASFCVSSPCSLLASRFSPRRRNRFLLAGERRSGDARVRACPVGPGRLDCVGAGRTEGLRPRGRLRFGW